MDVIPEKQHVRVTGDQEQRPDEPYRTLQLRNSATSFPAGQEIVSRLDKIGPPYWELPGISFATTISDKKAGSITCVTLPCCDFVAYE